MPVKTSLTSTSLKGLGHAIRSVADAVSARASWCCSATTWSPRHLHPHARGLPRPASASEIAVAPCSPADVQLRRHRRRARPTRSEGLRRVADEEPGAVWRVWPGGEARGRGGPPTTSTSWAAYLLATGHGPPHTQEPGKEGDPADHAAPCRSSSACRTPSSSTRLSGYDTGTLRAGSRPTPPWRPPTPASPTSSGGRRRARGITVARAALVQTLIPIRWLELSSVFIPTACLNGMPQPLRSGIFFLIIYWF